MFSVMSMAIWSSDGGIGTVKKTTPKTIDIRGDREVGEGGLSLQHIPQRIRRNYNCTEQVRITNPMRIYDSKISGKASLEVCARV